MSVLKSRKFKITLTIILILLLIFLLFFHNICYLLRPVTADRKAIVGYYTEEPDTIDLVYIGASTVYRFWSPMRAWEESGLTSYSFAGTGMPAPMNKYMLEESLKTQSPKLIIVDLYSYVARENNKDYFPVHIERISSSLKYSKERTDLIEDTVIYDLPNIPKTQVRDFRYDILMYYDRFDQLNKTSWKFADNKEVDHYKGFRFYAAQEPQNEPDFDVSKVDEKKDISKDTQKMLNDIMDCSIDNDVELLFIMSPLVITHDEKETLNSIEELILSRDFGFVDMCERYDDIGIDFETDYYNKNHVNVLGAEKYTDYLLEYIGESYELEDYSKEHQSNAWKNSLSVYKEKVDKTKNHIKNFE